MSPNTGTSILRPRSYWTSRIATSGNFGTASLPFFTDPNPLIQFIPVGAYDPVFKDAYYYYRNPTPILNVLLKDAFTNGLPDLPFNYCITQNVDAIFTISGRLNKYGEAIKVLMLIGEAEKPTDCIKKNQGLLHLNLHNTTPSPVLRPGETSVAVFDLIEVLIEEGVYRSRNDSYYGPLATHGVKLLQDRHGLPVTGIYEEYLYNAIKAFDA